MALFAVASLAVATAVSAQTIGSASQSGGAGQNGWTREGGWGNRGMAHPAIVGTVTAINGTTLTVSGRVGFATTTPLATYTVDASKAAVTKNRATDTLSSIAVGDTVIVQGTVSGSTVAATMIRDGAFPNGVPQGLERFRGNPRNTSSTPAVIGNGQPIVAGTVTAINGSTVSITNKSNVTYSIDASNATITRGAETVSLSNVAVGDTILVQGTVNGASVTASTIIDQTPPANATTTPQHPGQSPFGFFGRIGQFFLHLFGF